MYYDCFVYQVANENHRLSSASVASVGDNVSPTDEITSNKKNEAAVEKWVTKKAVSPKFQVSLDCIVASDAGLSHYLFLS